MQSDSKAEGLVGVRAPRFSVEIDAELFNRAEKELAAFVAVVNTLHGEEQARAAADDWLLELRALKEPCQGASLDLRSVTIGAAIRLGRRMSYVHSMAGARGPGGHRRRSPAHRFRQCTRR